MRVGWNLFLEKNKQACPFIKEVRVEASSLSGKYPLESTCKGTLFMSFLRHGKRTTWNVKKGRYVAVHT